MEGEKHKDIQEGIIYGVKVLDLNGIYNYEDGYCRGDSKKVYLVAVNLSGFLRLPEEFILTDYGCKVGGYRNKMVF